MVSLDGLEPTTYEFRIRCSTFELQGQHIYNFKKRLINVVYPSFLALAHTVAEAVYLPSFGFQKLAVLGA